MHYGLAGKSDDKWRFVSADLKLEDGNIVALLDGLGKRGWRVVAAGNFISGTDSDEVVLEHD